ncbi:hypothetical protein DFP72DRAFT_856133 [Ephemerocybe angulata]|uniref:Uncharacterized protein n=1 Tax=Ephemerocybe angulata TaxID=980116 RepID=A0A8H6LVR2_9AGAR|nr:hypothetical protein DFP72DRAFT_856133 [Tulosesus angulatus]
MALIPTPQARKARSPTAKHTKRAPINSNAAQGQTQDQPHGASASQVVLQHESTTESDTIEHAPQVPLGFVAPSEQNDDSNNPDDCTSASHNHEGEAAIPTYTQVVERSSRNYSPHSELLPPSCEADEPSDEVEAPTSYMSISTAKDNKTTVKERGFREISTTQSLVFKGGGIHMDTGPFTGYHIGLDGKMTDKLYELAPGTELGGE